MYDLFAAERHPKIELLARAGQDRRVDHPSTYIFKGQCPNSYRRANWKLKLADKESAFLVGLY